MSQKPCIYVIFGATGDLARKKIMPALQKLFNDGLMLPQSSIIAFSRRPWSTPDYHAFIKPTLTDGLDGVNHTESFLANLHYAEGHFQDPAGFQALARQIENIEKNAGGEMNKIFGLFVQPEFFLDVTKGLSESGLLKSKDLSKVLFEKPFGHDLASAEVLETSLEKYLDKDQIFRIDHYLAKDGLQKIIAERKTNAQFEQTLTHTHVAAVTIRFHEDIGVEGRGDFYETIGALRDVGQNHTLEMLAAMTMDISKPDETEARADVFRTLHIPRKENVVRAQYEGYTHDEEVSDSSTTETYFKITTEIQCERWSGVPIILEGGKALPHKGATVTVTYKDGSEKVFDCNSKGGRDAYETVLEHAIHGDRRFFVGRNEVMAAWAFVTPILKLFKEIPLITYEKGAEPGK